MPLLLDVETGTMTIDVKPVCIGPTWVRHAAWTPEKPIYVLPEHLGIKTLGWAVFRWIQFWVIDPDLSDEDAGLLVPWMPTDEQLRFLLWWYAVDERGRFVYRRGVLQRLKGWGKDPLAAVIALVELVGPCRFSHFDENGEPVAKENRTAYVQVAATSQDQTDNTMSLFEGMMSKKFRAKFRIDANKFIIYASLGRKIKAVTSSPRSLEGNRPSFVILNETHHWLSNNEGWDMMNTLNGNATKSKGGAARMLAITNAYEPSENSIAQKQREAWMAENSGLAIDTGVLYDSLEAPSDARIFPVILDAKTLQPVMDPATGDPLEPTEQQIKAYLAAVVNAVRGDASWLDVETIVSAILDTSNPASDSRRKWFNQVVAAEDAWLDPAWIDAAADPALATARRNGLVGDPLRMSWLRIDPKEPIVMFGDGSKADDSTGLVGWCPRTNFFFVIGVWQKPKGDLGKLWRAPRGEVDARVDEAFARFNIVAFFFDPSHTKDDENSTPYWDTACDGWHQRHGDRLQYWAVQSGDKRHSVKWDMTSPARQSEFVQGAERFREEMKLGGLFTHDSHPALVEHLRNAKANIANRYGVTLMKEHRESERKIDLAVCAVGAAMLARLVMNKGLEKPKELGRAWWAPVD